MYFCADKIVKVNIMSQLLLFRGLIGVNLPKIPETWTKYWSRLAENLAGGGGQRKKQDWEIKIPPLSLPLLYQYHKIPGRVTAPTCPPTPRCRRFTIKQLTSADKFSISLRTLKTLTLYWSYCINHGCLRCALDLKMFLFDINILQFLQKNSFQRNVTCWVLTCSVERVARASEPTAKITGINNIALKSSNSTQQCWEYFWI